MSTIDSTTKAPFFTMIGVTIFVVGISITATAQLVRINTRLENIEQKVADPWTMEKMKDWARMFEYANKVKYPDLVTPIVK